MCSYGLQSGLLAERAGQAARKAAPAFALRLVARPALHACTHVNLSAYDDTLVLGQDEDGKGIAAPELPRKPTGSPARLTGHARIESLPRAAATATLASVRDANFTALGVQPEELLAATAASKPGVVSIKIDAYHDGRGIEVPEAFIGISLEWQGVQYYAGGANGSAAPWASLMRALGPRTVLRIGGASQDRLQEVWLRQACLKPEGKRAVHASFIPQN